MKQERYYTYTADYIKGMVPHYERFVALADVESLEAENKRLNDICSEKSSEIYKLRGEKMALEQENAELRKTLDACTQVTSKEIARLRAALKGVNEYIGELQDDKVGCHFCGEESLCFTCGLLLSASDTIHKALEGK